MHCSYCGTKTKKITEDVTYRICKNAECRMCEITEPPNMMGDKPRTYDLEFTMKDWCELLDKTPSDISKGKTVDERMIDITTRISDLNSNLRMTEEDMVMRLSFQNLELEKENIQLKKKNKKLKKKIKRLKDKI